MRAEKSKIGKFHDFWVTNSSKFSPWRWKHSKKSCSHVSESTFYLFYSLKTKYLKKFFESEKLWAEKVENRKFPWFLCYKQYRIFALEMKTFEKILFPCLRKHIYQFYSLTTKIKKKVLRKWKVASRKVEKVEKVEKSEIFLILSHEKVPIFYFRHENFWENHVYMSQKSLFLWPNH